MTPKVAIHIGRIHNRLMAPNLGTAASWAELHKGLNAYVSDALKFVCADLGILPVNSLAVKIDYISSLIAWV